MKIIYMNYEVKNYLKEDHRSYIRFFLKLSSSGCTKVWKGRENFVISTSSACALH